ncbi:hypothetical protein D1007_48605 [Hordeum vulgare]|nr:hypothetical protein D1007_48605 [Hordeum vulgare]
MASAGKKGKVVASFVSDVVARPALMPSRISKAQDLGPVLLFVAGETDKLGATTVWSGSVAPSNLVRSTYPFFLHSIYDGLVLPFSDFFYAILSH